MTNATHDRLPRLAGDKDKTVLGEDDIRGARWQLLALIDDRLFSGGVLAQIHDSQYRELLTAATERFLAALKQLDDARAG